MTNQTEIRRTLKEEGYQIIRRKWLDSPIMNRGGYEAGRIERNSGKVVISYAVEAEALPAVMGLHVLCQEKDLSYYVTDISRRMDRLNGEIYWRENLLKGIKGLAKLDKKRRQNL
jgi:hypothetical protein